MDTGDAALIFLVVLSAIVLFSISFRQDYQTKAARKLAERSGLAPTDTQLPLLQEKIGRRQRGAVIGALFGGLLAWFFAANEPATNQLLIIAGALIAGGGVGIAMTALFFANRRPTDAMNYARSTSVTLADYSAPSDRYLVRGLVALSVIVAIVTAIMRQDHLVPALTLGLTTAAVAALAFFEISARQLVALGQPAGSVTELVYNDAIRAGYVFDLMVAPLTLGTFAALVGLANIVTSLGDPVVEALRPWTPLGLLAVIVVSAIRAARSDSGWHYLYRLWPDIAARAGGQLAVVTDDER